MQITKLEGEAAPKPNVNAYSQEDLQNEFDYLLAEMVLKKMFDKGLISDDECTRISEKNREIFSPRSAEIML